MSCDQPPPHKKLKKVKSEHDCLHEIKTIRMHELVNIIGRVTHFSIGKTGESFHFFVFDSMHEKGMIKVSIFGMIKVSQYMTLIQDNVGSVLQLIAFKSRPSLPNYDRLFRGIELFATEQSTVRTLNSGSFEGRTIPGVYISGLHTFHQVQMEQTSFICSILGKVVDTKKYHKNKFSMQIITITDGVYALSAKLYGACNNALSIKPDDFLLVIGGVLENNPNGFGISVNCYGTVCIPKLSELSVPQLANNQIVCDIRKLSNNLGASKEIIKLNKPNNYDFDEAPLWKLEDFIQSRQQFLLSGLNTKYSLDKVAIRLELYISAVKQPLDGKFWYVCAKGTRNGLKAQDGKYVKADGTEYSEDEITRRFRIGVFVSGNKPRPGYIFHSQITLQCWDECTEKLFGLTANEANENINEFQQKVDEVTNLHLMAMVIPKVGDYRGRNIITTEMRDFQLL